VRVQRKFRLTRSDDFKRVRRSGKSYAHPLVILIALKSESNEQDILRVGITAGRATGTAVHRNRAKRLLREAMRTLIPNLASHADLVLVARPALASATLADTIQALQTLLQRAQLVSSPNES
jgi:ribonuclease P protein component